MSALDPAEAREPATSRTPRGRRRRLAQPRPHRLVEVLLPAVVLAWRSLGWEAIVRITEIPPYILPAPSLIARRWSRIGASCRARCW